MHDRQKRKRVFHINMLRKWHVPTSVGYLAQEVADHEMEEEVPTWDGGCGQPKVGSQLDEKQRRELSDLLAEFGGVMQRYPGQTSLIEYGIQTGEAQPIRLPPYQLPHAYRDIVQKSLGRCLPTELLNHQLVTGQLP